MSSAFKEHVRQIQGKPPVRDTFIDRLADDHPNALVRGAAKATIIAGALSVAATVPAYELFVEPIISEGLEHIDARIRQERASQTAPGLIFDGIAESVRFIKEHVTA